MTEGYAGRNMMLMRIVSAEKAAEPKNINEKINKRSVRFDLQDAAGEDSNTTREFVIEDLKRLAAMDKAKSKAQEFVALAAKDGWESAVDKFNRIYGKGKDDTNTISSKKHTFTLNKQSGLRRINNLEIENLMTRYEGNPMARVLITGAKREGMLVDKLYALVPEDSNTLARPGAIVEYQSGMCYYCLESMTIHRLYQEMFDITKAAEVVRDEFVDSQALAFIYYNPKNIVTRMKFVDLQERQGVAEPNSVPADNNRTDK
jgi:DNA polymerase elongation subunit (family B)